MNRKYYIPAQNKKIYVDKEIFDEYNKLRSRQIRSNNRFRSHTCELKDGDDMIPVISVEEEVMKRLLLEQLKDAIDSLSREEKEIIAKLYFEEATERELAKQLKIKQPSLNERKKKILLKIKNKIF